MDNVLLCSDVLMAGTPPLGAGGQMPPLPSVMGGQAARIALHTELFPSLLSSEGAFSGGEDSLVQENVSGDKSPNPNLGWRN